MSEDRNIRKSHPVKVGIVGTGYAATKRVEALKADARAIVTTVAGHTLAKTQAFAESYGLAASPHGTALATQPDLDLVVIGNVNSEHGEIVRQALLAGKSVVVEYPLALSAVTAQELVTLAQQQRSLLHVEHIELLGGLHQAVKAHLPAIGTPHYVRYSTAVPQYPAPQRWTFNRDRFGFPLAGALSRLHRLTNLFGPVDTVACQLDYAGLDATTGYFRNCRCVAHLRFHSGVVAEVLYAKGESTWQAQRDMVIEGDQGALVFAGETGNWLHRDGTQPIEVGGRRGLFALDTTLVLDALTTGKPLYVTPQESVYALQVATAAASAATTGQTVKVPPPAFTF